MSPVTVVILLAALAGSGYKIWMILDEQRLERLLATPKHWPTTTVPWPVPVTAVLTTSHEGAFLRYRFTVTPSTDDPAAVEAVNGIAFTIRLIDKDGFTLLVIRPPDGLTLDRSGGQNAFRAEDVIGCGAMVYAAATSWAVEWEGLA